MIWGGADVIAIEIKCTINVMHFNHWETVPLPICGKTVFQKISPGYPMWWSLETGPTGVIRDQCPCKRDPKNLSHPFHTWGHGISESDGKSAGTLLLASPASTPWEIITIVYKPLHLQDFVSVAQGLWNKIVPGIGLHVLYAHHLF